MRAGGGGWADGREEQAAPAARRAYFHSAQFLAIVSNSLRLNPLPLLAAVALVGVHPARGAAQVGSTTDIITGTVRGPDSLPIAGAVVQAISIETQVSRQRTTDSRGRFTIVFPDGGGQYQLVARYIGMAPARVTVARQADEDRLVADIRMGLAAVPLEPVTVTARRTPRGNDRPTPGSTERDLSPQLLTRLPIDASDLNLIATLAPGVVGIAGTDSSDAAFSVAGQRTTANDITLDGMSFGSGSVPQDAVRSTRVVTSTYDVARGQFSGGLVASTTRSGTNVPQGSYTYTLRDKDLAWGGPTNSAFGQGYTQNQLGGGMGGPIIANKLFVFGALQGRWRDQGLTSLTSADGATLARLGVNPDSVARFIALAQQAGAPITLPGLPDDRATDNTVGLLRLDWNISDVQTLMLRLDGRWNSQQPTRLGALALPPTGGTMSQTGGGVMASLTSYLGGNFINEVRGYVSRGRRDNTAYVTLPAGRVQVASALSDTGQSVTNLSLGSNTGFPQTSDTRALEVSDEFSWLPGRTAHRIKLGLYLNGTELQENQAVNQLGTFTFPSLSAFAADSAAMFTRTLSPLERQGTAWNAALYLGDIWRLGGGAVGRGAGGSLQVTYGARIETASFNGAPAFNPTVDSLFGLRTDHIPTEVHVSPRAGFTWMIAGSDGPASTIVRGGAGDFRSLTPTGLYSAALAAPGLSNAEEQLVCIGSAVPTPDWTAYMQDPGAIPSQCSDTVNAITITPHPNVTVFDPSFDAPRAWRASLGVQRRVLGTYTVSLDASYARGMSQYGFRDLNLVTTPMFTLANEGNRPVYVPPDSIIPATGALSSTDSRRYPQFGQVLVIGSDLESDTKQVTLGFGGFTGRGMSFQVSYTYTRAMDQSSFGSGASSQGFAAASTGGDPNVREWATSSFERRHSFLGTLTYPFTGAIEITAIGRLTSGTPFTPSVGSDNNGDGARNDRAFVFNPATTADTGVARAMRALLGAAPSAVRSCLEAQLDQVAARNSCSGPWQPSLDLQLNWRPSWFGLDRRLTLSAVTVNLLGGLDEWLHGTDHLAGWGFSAAPDPVLLYVRGFDPASQTFRYAVNQRFGAIAGANGGVTVPFQLGIQAHLAIGPDRTRDRLRSAFGGGGGRAGRGGLLGADSSGTAFAARFAQILPNPISVMVSLKDTLHLADSQVTALQAIADSLDAKNGAVRDSLRADVQRGGDRPDPGVLFARMRPRLQAGRENIRKAIERAHAVLTPEQWKQLPDALKSPGFGGGDGDAVEETDEPDHTDCPDHDGARRRYRTVTSARPAP